ncbi:hypothetical protein BGX27_005442, partial [Mortierella sp. AM989]
MASRGRRHPEYYVGRAWGSFEYTHVGQRKNIRFTKQGDGSHSGVLGYVFGRRPDCDVILPPTELTSARHFLIYKEVERATECVYLRDLSTNGTLVNDALIGTGKTVRLEDGDIISYIALKHKGKECSHGANVHVQKRRARDQFDRWFTKTFDSQFKIGEQLGSGNFASVFKTTERKSGIAYAVKVVKKSANFDLKQAQSLEREIGTLMSIDHPSLLRIYKVFSEDRYHYVVTELARGGELFDRVKEKRRFSEPEARFVFRQLLNGVKYLHDRGIVHRDLKLENILLMDMDTLIVKISDFGLANVIGEQMFLNTICGTPSYVAPEVIRNQDYGKAVDMWSLDELAPPRMRTQILENRYTFPSPYWDDVSDEAVNMVQDLLLHDTERRLTVDGALSHVWMNLNQSKQLKESLSSSSIEESTRGHGSLSSSSVPQGDDSDSTGTIPALNSDSDNNGVNSNDDKDQENEKSSQTRHKQKISESLFGSSVETLVDVEPDNARTVDARAKKKR